MRERRLFDNYDCAQSFGITRKLQEGKRWRPTTERGKLIKKRNYIGAATEKNDPKRNHDKNENSRKNREKHREKQRGTRRRKLGETRGPKEHPNPLI